MRGEKARLAGAVYERAGVAIDPSDPAFALVELNRLVLQDAVDELVRQITERTDSLPERVSVLTAVASKRMVELALQRVADRLQAARKQLEVDASGERENIRRYAEAARASQLELGTQLVRSARTVSLVAGVVAAIAIILAIAAVTIVLAATK